MHFETMSLENNMRKVAQIDTWWLDTKTQPALLDRRATISVEGRTFQNYEAEAL